MAPPTLPKFLYVIFSIILLFRLPWDQLLSSLSLEQTYLFSFQLANHLQAWHIKETNGYTPTYLSYSTVIIPYSLNVLNKTLTFDQF